jgi:hypothetical protein
MALCEGRFLQPCDAPLASGTGGAISHVAATFRSHGYPNLSHDKHGNLDWNLSRQYRAYKISDPKKNQQKAILFSVLSLIAQVQTTETQKATAQLTIATFFFACRSCKYLKLKNSQDKKTNTLTLKNIAFYKDDNQIPHSLVSALTTADRVSIMFIMQKNGRKLDTITQWKTGNNVVCPVIQWAAIVKWISRYKGALPTTPVSAIWLNNQISHVTSKIIEHALQDAVVAMGETKLCIKKHEIGSHSIQLGAVMAMYLGGVPVFTIMMIGRWGSNAFMKYIQKQIEEFTFNVLSKMLTMQHFHYAPNATNSLSKKNEYGRLASLMLENH